MNNAYSVYIHTFPNGKKYVGITGQNPNRRWNNGHGYCSQEFIHRAIVKYGWDNVTHEVVCSGLSKSDAEDVERMLIRQYSSNDLKCGYNVQNGGCSHGKHSETSKIKMSINHPDTCGSKNPFYGKRHTPESKKKMSEWQIGCTPPNKGIKHSEETKKKISIANSNPSDKTRLKMSIAKQGLYHNETHPRARGVVCMETGALYLTIKQAAEHVGIDYTNILKVCSGNRKTAGGYTWTYATRGGADG